MKKNRTIITLIFPLILLIILIGIFLYFFNVIKNKNKHTSSVVIALNQKIIENNNVSLFNKKIEELNYTNDLIGSFIVDKSNIDKFVEYLEGLGVNNNVELKVVGVDTDIKLKNKILVSLKMLGEFSNIMKVIALLENSQYNIIIDSSYLYKEIKEDGASVDLPEIDGDSLLNKDMLWKANVSFSVLSST